MATWHGQPKKRRVEVYRPENYGYCGYEEVEFGWNYNTTSDTFMPYEKLHDKEPEWGDILGQDRAEALLYSLAEWCNAYVGEEYLDKLIEEIRKGGE
jgi:hypothetical protein